MRYLIDGYNLAHATGDIEGKLSSRGLERARLSIIHRVATAHGPNAGEVTLVFDAENAPRDTPEQIVIEGVDVRNTLDEEADDLIERLIKAHSAPKQLTVVSSDRRIKDAGRRRGCKVFDCNQYLDLMERTTKPAAKPAEDSGKPEPASPEETARWLEAFRPEKRSSDPLRRRGRRN